MPRRLTAEERKAVWAPPESNAGAGWWPKGQNREVIQGEVGLEIVPYDQDEGDPKPLDFED
jgi:hypothetical protein